MKPLPQKLFFIFCFIFIFIFSHIAIAEVPKKLLILPFNIHSEKDLANEIARIADVSKELGYRIEAQDRLLTKEEAYTQISHSASLFKAILAYVEKMKGW